MAKKKSPTQILQCEIDERLNYITEMFKCAGYDILLKQHEDGVKSFEHALNPMANSMANEIQLTTTDL